MIKTTDEELWIKKRSEKWEETVNGINFTCIITIYGAKLLVPIELEDRFFQKNLKNLLKEYYINIWTDDETNLVTIFKPYSGFKSMIDVKRDFKNSIVSEFIELCKGKENL